VRTRVPVYLDPRLRQSNGCVVVEELRVPDLPARDLLAAVERLPHDRVEPFPLFAAVVAKPERNECHPRAFGSKRARSALRLTASATLRSLSAVARTCPCWSTARNSGRSLIPAALEPRGERSNGGRALGLRRTGCPSPRRAPPDRPSSVAPPRRALPARRGDSAATQVRRSRWIPPVTLVDRYRPLVLPSRNRAPG
jgi:hypothetical protein